jgi:sensor histidine kinase YesM
MHKGLEFLIKYKVFHMLFWIAMVAFQYHSIKVSPKDTISPIFFLIANQMLVNAIVIYTFTNIFVERFFKTKKFSKLFISYVVLTCIAALVGYFISVIFIYKQQHTTMFFVLTYISTLIDCIVTSLIFISIVLIYEIFKQQQETHQKEKDFLNNEIEMLKTQMNPHFIFNALNSIYALMGIDNKKAEEALTTFSELLRHQLYESQQAFVPLEKEIDFLEKYIALEKMRKEDDLVITQNIQINKKEVRIAPILLQPIIENAFKYVSNNREKNYINIEIIANTNEINCTINNSIDEINKIATGGIGLVNVKRRLELLYHKDYSMAIHKTDQEYCIQLQINTTNNDLYNNR